MAGGVSWVQGHASKLDANLSTRRQPGLSNRSGGRFRRRLKLCRLQPPNAFRIASKLDFGGVALELPQGRDKYLVRCQQWKSTKVGVATVRELYGEMAAEGAVGGFVVASGRFTEDARTFAEGRSSQLPDAGKLRSLIASTPLEAQAETARRNEAREISAGPKCGKAMVKRTAKSGNNAGKLFGGGPLPALPRHSQLTTPGLAAIR